MPKISFVGLSPFPVITRKSVTGAWLKKRIRVYSWFMPPSAARRVARKWNITPGTTHYNSGLGEGLEILDEYIKKLMEVRRISRQEAVKGVWRNIKKDFRERGRMIETSQDLLHWWLTDTLESP